MRLAKLNARFDLLQRDGMFAVLRTLRTEVCAGLLIRSFCHSET